ncbi:MAG TPA: DUF2934 domain-containing protein [Steroidobacter sp.]|uniref:DUF2934 domain-containing protein n=1 Tax=Steroidobacter sp. TaxID=1978227 RepID=UPI002ED90849
MEFTPDTSPPKRTRAKSKVVAAKPAETQSAAAKKPRAPRKTPTDKTAAPATTEVQVVAATLDPTPEDVGTMIATAAYYLAAARNFSPGHELDDWLEAERAVHAKLYG